MNEKPDYNILKAVILALVFFTLTPLTIGISLFSLLSIQKSNQPAPHVVLAAQEIAPTEPVGVQVFASLPETMAGISGAVVAKDARAEIIKQYLNSYNSPLSPYAQKIVEAADKYGVDFRLITAIAQQESNLCKKIPENTYNCWGWGIHSSGTLGFASFEEGINVVTQGIKEKYINQGYVTPEEIMAKYTPASPGSWANGVSTFLGQME